MSESDIRRKTLGRSGEDLAASFFVAKGYSVVDRNWHCRMGEVDLIVRRGDEWRFVEVKTRSNLVFGYPEASVTSRKCAKFRHAIEAYMSCHDLTSSQVHADVLAIVLNGREFDIQWFEDAT